MKRFLIFALVTAVTLSSSNGFAQDDTVDRAEPTEQSEEQEEPLAFGFDLLPFLGTSSSSPDRRRVVSLNLGGGLSGGIDLVEVAPGFNISTGDLRGAQIAGGFNIVAADVEAAQIAGGFNIASGLVDGVQVAGGFNVAGGEVTGVQVAPINVAGGHVNGVQIGVVNIARSADVGVGIIGIYTDGYLQAEAFGSDDGLLMGGIRHGSGSFYNVYFVGTRPFADGEAPLSYGLGVGWRAAISDRTDFSLDLTATTVVGGGTDWSWRDQYNLFKLRPMLSVDVFDGIALFGGPTVTLLVDADSHGSSSDVDELALIGGWELTDEGDDATVGIWPGFTVGARFF